MLYIDDGDVLASGGVAAGIDLCLHIVRKDHGAEIANRLGRLLVFGPHRGGGQAQFVEQPVPDTDTGNERLGHALSRAIEHLPQDLTWPARQRRRDEPPDLLPRVPGQALARRRSAGSSRNECCSPAAS